MNPTAARTSRAALAAFFLFAAALGLALGATSAEASLPRSADTVSEASTPLQLELPKPAPPSFDPRLGFASSLELLAPERAPSGFELLPRPETCRCEITYARNNPLKYVDRNGRENELAIDAMQRDQVRELYGEAAVSRMDAQRAVMGMTALALLGGGAAVAEWGPAILAFGQQVLSRFGDKVSGEGLPRALTRTLDRLASSGTSSVELFTSQTKNLEAGKALYTAAGENAVQLAKLMQPGGQLSSAKVPIALLEQMEAVGLASKSVLQSPSGVQTTEWFFTKKGADYILQFFKAVSN